MAYIKVGGRYMDEDEYADALEEARRDAYYEGLEEQSEPSEPEEVPTCELR